MSLQHSLPDKNKQIKKPAKLARPKYHKSVEKTIKTTDPSMEGSQKRIKEIEDCKETLNFSIKNLDLIEKYELISYLIAIKIEMQKPYIDEIINSIIKKLTKSIGLYENTKADLEKVLDTLEEEKIFIIFYYLINN